VADNDSQESTMVKKLKAMANKQAAGQNNLADAVKDSAQQIWLAGLAAFNRAQAEGGKVFETLVKEGTALQKKTQAIAEDRVSEATSRMTAVAEGITSRAGQQWDKLEGIFEERVAKALNKLGVPTRKDIESLLKRVEELNKNVQAMSGAKAKAATKTAANGVRKPAAKRAAARAAR
jgi:poly(hydroxyalkanoate) granule-associated protein